MQKGREAVLAMKEDTDKNIKQLQEEVKKDKTGIGEFYESFICNTAAVILSFYGMQQYDR